MNRSASTLVRCAAILLISFTARAQDRSGVLWSDLPVAQQEAILKRVEPPPLHERDNPYSTPMYYLMAKGYSDGVKGELVLDRNRPDWQEAILKDWAELGLTSTHFLTSPGQWDDPDTIEAIKTFVDLSQKYGLRVGIRLGGDNKMGGIEGSGWDLHPKNPKNRIDEYVAWTQRVAQTLKGKVEYYVIGDEVNGNSWEEVQPDGTTIHGLKAPEDKRWTAAYFMEVFPKLSNAIKSNDPAARVSMFGMGGLDWDYVEQLVALGYAKVADGVAANFGQEPPEKMQEFVRKVKAIDPNYALYSNGVGYVGATGATAYPSNHGYKVYSDEEQAARVASVMFKSFESGWNAAPYYIVVRQWVMPDGKIVPHWYGLFGFEDLLLDSSGNLTFKHHAAWSAFQTIAHVFHSHKNTQPAKFKASTSKPVDQIRVYERNDYECLIVLWNESEKTETVNVELPTGRYSYPVHVPLSNWRQVVPLSYETTTDGKLTIRDVKVSLAPTIIRLVAEPQVSR